MERILGDTRISIRQARNSDVGIVADIWHEGWGDGHLGDVRDELTRHRRIEDLRILPSTRTQRPRSPRKMGSSVSS